MMSDSRRHSAEMQPFLEGARSPAEQMHGCQATGLCRNVFCSVPQR